MSSTVADDERAVWATRIAVDAARAPMVLAQRIVGRHFAELRTRGLLTVPPNTPGLVLAREQLTHDVASAILDARLADLPSRGTV